MQIIEWFRQKTQNEFDNKTHIILLIFIFHLFLIFNELTPNLREINLWDEAVYINSGKQLVEGQLIPYHRNPLVGFLYALSYLPYQSSPYWMMQSATLGRVILFSLLWISSYLAARQLQKVFSPFVLIGFLVVFPLLTDILENPSDSLFAAMSAFGLWQLFRFYNLKNTRHLAWASFFIALSALSRNDGIVLFLIFLFIALLIIYFHSAQTLKVAIQAEGEKERKKGRHSQLKNISAALFPFVAIIGCYTFFYGFATGDYAMGTKERAYVAFQQGHMFVYTQNGECILKEIGCTSNDANELFGAPEENNYSVLKAISRNPGAYLQRVFEIVKQLPKITYYAYGLRTGYVIFLFAARGMIELIKKKNYAVLLILMAWPAYLLTYFLTFFREGYLRGIFFILFILEGIGICSTISNIKNRSERYLWTSILLVLTAYGISTNKSWLYFNAIALLVGLWISYFGADQHNYALHTKTAGLLIMLSIGIILRGKFTPYEKHNFGDIAEEQAVVYLQEHIAPGSLVAAGAPGAIWAARMEYTDIVYELSDELSGEAIHERIVAEGIKAIYVDHYLSNLNRPVWGLIQEEIGDGFERVFSGREGSIQVLLVNP